MITNQNYPLLQRCAWVWYHRTQQRLNTYLMHCLGFWCCCHKRKRLLCLKIVYNAFRMLRHSNTIRMQLIDFTHWTKTFAYLKLMTFLHTGTQANWLNIEVELILRNFSSTFRPCRRITMNTVTPNGSEISQFLSATLQIIEVKFSKRMEYKRWSM